MITFNLKSLGAKRSGAIAALAILLFICFVIPALCLWTRATALDSFADEQNLLARLEAARHRAANKAIKTDTSFAAPEAALLHSQTRGQASAELEAYVAQLVSAQQSSLVSSGVQPISRGDPGEAVRIQVILDTHYEDLQKLLYRLEAGTPYVFVDGFTARPSAVNSSNHEDEQAMKVTLNLRALWHQAPYTQN